MMNYKIILTHLFILLSFYSFNQLPDIEIEKIIQSRNEEQIVEWNTKLLYEGLLVQSEILADELLKFQPENANYNFRKGYLIKEIRKDYVASIPFLLKAITHTKPQFDAFSAKEINAPADAYYHLGVCYHRTGEIENAKLHYTNFLQKSTKKSVLYAQAEIGLLQLSNGQELIKTPVNYSIENMGNTINSPYPDYCAVPSLDGNTLYYTSKRRWRNGESDNFKNPMTGEFPEDVYASRKNNNTWQNESILPFCLPNRNEASVAISPDERLMYLYEDSTGSGDLFQAQIYPENFTKIEKVPYQKLNTSFWETHCGQTIDGNTIYFSSDRPGGFGGRDLYVMNKVNGNWTEPENLGPEINSALDEDSPFFAQGKLYFSSNGKKSMGGFDMFEAEELSNNKWTIKNLGYPANGWDDDLYYTETTDGQFGYFTSTRPNGLGDKDIYQINYFKDQKNSMLIGKFTTPNNEQFLSENPVYCEIQCLDCSEKDKKFTRIYPELNQGNLSGALKLCHSYHLSFIAIKTKDVIYEEDIKISCESVDTLTRNFALDGGKFVLQRDIKILLTIKESNTKLKLDQALIQLFNDKDELKTALTSDVNGEVILKIPANTFTKNQNEYKLKISKSGYVTSELSIQETHISKNDIKMVLELSKEPSISETLNKSITFRTNSATLNETATRILDEYIVILRSNPHLKIEIYSHTDCVGTEEYNSQLSLKRAKTVETYILKQINDRSRLRSLSFGESQPIVDCKCDDKIVPCSSDQLSSNRRTEFKITSN